MTKRLPKSLAVETRAGKFVTAASSTSMSYYPPRWFSPLLSFVHFYIPWDRATLNQQIRYYDTFHALIGTAIDLHAELPLSSFELKNIKDPAIKAFYEEALEYIDAASLMFDMLREYWLMGEVFVFLNWSDEFGTFTEAELLIPERIRIRALPFVTETGGYEYEYIIDTSIYQRLEPQLKEKIIPDLLANLEKGNNLIVEPQNLMTMMRKTCPYDERGTSVVLRVFRELIYESKLIESMYAIADRWVSPKEIWKIGDSNYIPDQQQLDDFKKLLIDAENQPQFTLVTHGLVSVDVVGATGKWPNLQSEYEWVERRILSGLFLNKALVHGEGPTYATASVGYRALMSRYLAVRAKLERIWKEKFFLPIALANEFYETVPSELSHKIRRPYAERVPCIPDFEWRHKADLLDDQSYRNLLMQLRSKGDLPLEIIAEAIGYDPQYIKDSLERESGTILDPAYREFLKKMQDANIQSILKPASLLGDPEKALTSYKEIMKKNASDFIDEASKILSSEDIERCIQEVDKQIPDDAKFGLISRGMHGKGDIAVEALKVKNPYVVALANMLGDKLLDILKSSEKYGKILSAIKRKPEEVYQEMLQNKEEK